MQAKNPALPSAATAERSTAEPLVLTQIANGVGRLTLNHPGKRNALSRRMLEAMQAALARLREDDAVRAIIIAANGPVFSAGHDLNEFIGASAADVRAIIGLCSQVMDSLRQIPKPVLAQVQGLATAAGCQLAASCDLVVASRAAGFQLPGVNFGLFCSTPMIPVSRAIPIKKTLEMLFTGQPITAEEAERQGLVNRVVEPELLASATDALAQQIIKASASTLAIGKLAFYRQLPRDLPGAYAVGSEAMSANAMLPDAQAGMAALLHKRKPHPAE